MPGASRTSNRIRYARERDMHPRRSWATRAHAGAAYRCRRTGRAFALPDDFLERNLPLICPALGVPLVIGRETGQGGGPWSPTVDRVDNRKGYLPSNVVVVSKRANSIKSNRTVQEIRVMADAARRGELEPDQARVFLFYEALTASVHIAA